MRSPNQLNNLNVKKCEFVSQSEQGLKTHTTRKHTAISKGGYPKSCDLCESDITSAAMMKIHLKSHSFKEAKFQCEDCEFVGQSKDTMEVHAGKTHTDNYECGLREVNFENGNDLETHINTCEIYRCKRCYLKFIQLSDVKAHVEKKHKGVQSTLIQHLKISCVNSDEVSSKEYWYTEL